MKALIINGHQKHAISEGNLNKAFVELAKSFLEKNNYKVKITCVDKGYSVNEEVDKLLWADLIIYQMPVYWMSLPWGFKKYIEEVFSGGKGKLFIDDGRTRSAHAKYGSGGLMQGKKYFLSLTWNAPIEALEDKNQFFEGKGNDGVFFDFHKANQFIGMQTLNTFSCHDVVKSPEITKDFVRFKKHLQDIILNL